MNTHIRSMTLPRPPLGHERSQLAAFLTLRRDPLELWGPRAYEEDILDGRFLGRIQVMRFARRGAVIPRAIVTTQPDRPVHFRLTRR